MDQHRNEHPREDHSGPSPDQRLHEARAAAGRKGGRATLNRHGRDFFRRIGRIGGKRRTGAKHAR